MLNKLKLGPIVYISSPRIVLDHVGAQSLQLSPTLKTLWTVALQAPLSMEFSRQEYWSGFPCHLPEDLPSLGIEPLSLALQADSLSIEPPGKPPLII